MSLRASTDILEKLNTHVTRVMLHVLCNTDCHCSTPRILLPQVIVTIIC